MLRLERRRIWFRRFCVGLDSPCDGSALTTETPAIPDGCHFDHSRHVQVWKIFGKNDFQDQDRFLSVALSPVIQGKEDGAQASFELEDVTPGL